MPLDLGSQIILLIVGGGLLASLVKLFSFVSIQIDKHREQKKKDEQSRILEAVELKKLDFEEYVKVIELLHGERDELRKELKQRRDENNTMFGIIDDLQKQIAALREKLSGAPEKKEKP